MTGVRKTVAFGVLGALAGVISASAWEQLIGKRIAQVPAPIAAPVPANSPTNVPTISRSVEQKDLLRIARTFEELRTQRGAKTGDLQVTLQWGNRNDLDLHFVGPSGFHIFYGAKRDSDGFYLDIDANAGARDGAVSNPIEHIYLSKDLRGSSGTPSGHYRILVDFYAQHLQEPGPTKYYLEVIRRHQGAAETKEYFEGETSPSSLRRPQLVHEFDIDNEGPPETTLSSNTSRGFDWQAVIYLAIWTAGLAAFLCAFLMVGQNVYLYRRLVSTREAVLVFSAALGGFIIGGAAAIFHRLYQSHSALGGVQDWIAIATWSIFGIFFGALISRLVPNLKLSRVALAGGAGALIGSSIFILIVENLIGPAAGRVFHGGMMGLFIGLMVPIAESVFREAYLEVAYGPKEVRQVSLGTTAVTVGSSQSATVYAHGAPPIALSYMLKDGQVLLEDVPAKKLEKVGPGDRRGAGRAVLTLVTKGHTSTLTAAPPHPQTAVKGPAIRIAGNTIPLTDGQKLFWHQFPGLHSTRSDGVVAEVVQHPKDPSKLGLKNHSGKPWMLETSAGTRAVDVGQSVQLSGHSRIRCDGFEAELIG